MVKVDYQFVRYEFSDSELNLLRPVVLKRLQELKTIYDSSSNTNGADISKANEAFNKLIVARNNLEEACKAAKYYKFVFEDCEPCKAVQ